MPTMPNRWKPNVTVAAIVEQEGRFLLVEENSGVIDIIGYQNGCRLDVADGSSAATDLGHSLTFRAKNQNGLPPQFNNGTSLADTIDDLNALVIGS
jgi:hypothetical protein